VGLDVHAKAYQISDGKLIGLKYLYLIVLPLRCEVVVGCAHASTRACTSSCSVVFTDFAEVQSRDEYLMKALFSWAMSQLALMQME
jgi:hypothetical protein